MKLIPLAAVPNQNISVLLGAQNCQISVYTKSTGLFVDLSVDNVPIVTAALALDRNRIVRVPGDVFVGDLTFYDTQGLSDPTYDGFATRYQFAYIEPTDDLY
jgi:hypothetical protein